MGCWAHARRKFHDLQLANQSQIAEQAVRQKVPESSATAKAIDYSLRRWRALTRFLQDGQLPVDNNWDENQIRPIAIGRNNWLFAGSLRGGQRAAAVMSLIQSAKLNGHHPHAYRSIASLAVENTLPPILLDIKHQGKFKSLTQGQKKSLKQRQAIEPIIGHLKADHRMNRCYLKGSLGDNLHAVLCAAGFNIGRLLRMISSMHHALIAHRTEA